MDFLTRSSIYYALIVSPIVSTSCVEQFWTTAKSRTVNNISHIDATVAGKPVTILEASIRSYLLFDDADGIDSLNNQAILDNTQLMGYKGDLNTLTFNKALFSPQWKFLFHTMNHCISSKSTSWDQIPTNIATAVICLATNQKYNFSKLIFGGMIRHLDATKKFVMYPRFLQIFLSNQLKDVFVPLDHFPVPTLTKKVLTFMVKKGKNFLGKVTPLFDSMLVQQTEDEGAALERPSDSQPIPSPPHSSEDQPQTQTNPSPRPSPSIAIPDSNPEGSGGNHGGQSSSDRSLSGNEDGLTLQSVYDLCISLCIQVSAQAKEIKALKAQVKKLKKGVKQLITHHKAWIKSVALKTRLARKTSLNSVVLEEKEGADKEVLKLLTKVSTDRQGEGIADQNEGKSATQTAPTTTSTPTPIISCDDETIAQVLITMSQNKQKEKEKGVEIRNVEDTERPRPTSTRSMLTLKPLPKIDPKDKGKKMIDEEGESNTESDDITEAKKKFKMLAKDEEARINADKILAEELQKEEREKFTIEQRAKFLHDTIAAQRKFLAQQRSEAIRNKPPTRNQLRNQMITYLKHVGGKKHSDLKTKTFEEIQVLYEILKRQDQNFIAIGSAKDERQIKELNKDPKKKRVIKETPRKEDTAKVPAEQEVTEQGTKKRKSGHVKMLARKRPRPQPDDDSDDEHRKCLRIITFDNYDLVMKQYSEITPEDIKLILWGDLKIMMEFATEENDQELKDRTVIYMLVERKYPLSKELLQQMLDLGLEVEEESTTALQLDIRDNIRPLSDDPKNISEDEEFRIFGDMFGSDEPPRFAYAQNVLNERIDHIDEPRRSNRKTTIPRKLGDYVLDKRVKCGIDKSDNYSNLSKENYVFSKSLNKIIELKIYLEAIKDHKWIEAINLEIEALNRNMTWVIIELPVGSKPIGCKWVFKLKYKSNGSVEIFMTRLVAKEYNQKEGIDYEKTFTPVVKIVTVTCIRSLVVSNNWPMFQLDINNAFLYGKLVEDVYMKLPKGFFDKSDNRAYKLTSVTCEVMWIMRVCIDLKVQALVHVEMSYDNSSAMQFASNLVLYERTKQFEIDLFFLREKIAKRIIKTVKVKSEENVADILTNGLSIVDHKRLCGICLEGYVQQLESSTIKLTHLERELKQAHQQHVECNLLSTKLPKNSVVGRLPLTKALGGPDANFSFLKLLAQSYESYGSDTSLAKSLTEESKVRRNHHTVVTLQTLQPTLLYDIVCTITDMQFAAYHGAVHTGQMEAYHLHFLLDKKGKIKVVACWTV
ncbi:ribonuclease H-like domain-containing protein [Tanacetum coccineum]